MGNREDLLAGALTCLKDKGWARTTVRDIAAAAGVNHAAIGYHFGSRDALMTQAFMQAIEEWGEEVEAAVRASTDKDATPREQYEAFWRTAIASFRTNPKLWLATVEASIEAQHNPRIAEIIQEGMREGRSGLAAGLLGKPEESLDAEAKRTVGAVQMALMSGILIQWLFDPDSAPSGADIATGVTALAAHIGDAPSA
ncbi:TetR/AcrR family transcriptional regulator [Fodinicola acaciae]|uniref:TetR/AcrR family transcriptional regulator n=1 Tax=Fodinicola acaciae TaxID=2681555 RepID=UPI0013D424D4|nr:TetR/AcrR family transcriptional regulator [Fodinicola acaciae]